MTQIHYQRFKTLEELLKHYEHPDELANYIDHAMLSLVVLMYYEPERVKLIISSYESLWELKNLILNQSQS